MPGTGYNHGKIRCLADIKKIQDEDPNIPKVFEECDKSFHWKWPY